MDRSSGWLQPLLDCGRKWQTLEEVQNKKLCPEELGLLWFGYQILKSPTGGAQIFEVKWEQTRALTHRDYISHLVGRSRDSPG